MPQIFGRDAEQEVLGAFVRDVGGGPRALVLHGEAGIGKTTLWETGVSFASGHGYTVLSCRPSQSESALSSSALGDLLSGIELTDELPEPQRHALDVALLRAPPDGRSADRRTVSVATLGRLRSLATEAPVLIAIDDVQWLDRSSAAVIAFCVRRLTVEPIALLLASRTGGGEGDVLELTRALPEDRLQRIWVEPLDVPATTSLVQERFGLTLSRADAALVHDASHGNPFFALELARAMLISGAGDLPRGIFHAPQDVRDLLRARIGDLSPAVHEVLLTAAASSHPTVPLLQAVSARPERVEELLRRAADVDVIEVEGDGVRFTHPLLASAVYEEASARRRRDVHRRIAEAAEDPEERARHLALSTSEPDEEVAAALEKAARLAIERGAPASAGGLCEDAVRFTPPEATSDRRRRQLAASEHHFIAGDQAAATRLGEAVVASSPTGIDRALALERLGRIRMEDDLDEAARLLAEAIGEEGATDRLMAEGLIDLAIVRLNLGDLQEAERSAGEALAIAERNGEGLLVADALSVRAVPRAYLGHGIDREGFARAWNLAGSIERYRVDWDPRAPLAELLVVTDELDEARPILIELLATAEERGDEPSAAFFRAYLAHLELRAGRWNEALAHAGSVDLWGDEGAIEAIVHARRGAFDIARSLATRSLEHAEGSGHVGPMLEALEALGTVELALGRFDAAHGCFERAWEIVERSSAGEPNKAMFLADWIEVLIRIGDVSQAEARVEWLEERGHAVDRPRARAIAARGRGRLAAMDGEIVEAIDHLDRAIEEHDRFLDPFELGRTLLLMGMVRRRAKQKRSAREALERAVTIFDGLGADPSAEAARSEIAAIGGRPVSAGGLTPTEDRVAHLASAGLNNREIADRLVLSARTVEGHLSRAYRKLGIRSRSQLRHALEDEVAG